MVDTYATAVEKRECSHLALELGISYRVPAASAKNIEWLSKTAQSLINALPNYPGMISTEESVAKQLKVIAEATAKDTGAFLRI
jgi:hypothetical protein